jgi:hypothetical protein
VPRPSSAEAITYTLSEEEFIAYSDLVTKRQARCVPPQRSWVSGVYVPLALGALLMAVCALRGLAGQAEFGPMLVMGTVAYLGGFFALHYELSRDSKRRRVAFFRTDPMYREPRLVMLREDALEYASASFTAQYSYRAFTDVEVTQDFVLGWLGSAAAALVPVRAFANRSEAEAFAGDLRRRIDTAHAAAAKKSNEGRAE